jgi:hypothetical protein
MLSFGKFTERSVCLSLCALVISGVLNPLGGLSAGLGTQQLCTLRLCCHQANVLKLSPPPAGFYHVGDVLMVEFLVIVIIQRGGLSSF